MNVSSSHIKSMWYRDNVLTIEFKSGRKYEYHGVGRALWEAFREAESKGQFFNQYIKGKFGYKEITDDSYRTGS